MIKSYKDIDRPESCKCGSEAVRYISRTHFYGADDWNKAAFNPAFGKIIKSKAHLREELAIARSEGREMVEVGNESLENIHHRSERERADRRDKRWYDVSRELGIPI